MMNTTHEHSPKACRDLINGARDASDIIGVMQETLDKMLTVNSVSAPGWVLVATMVYAIYDETSYIRSTFIENYDEADETLKQAVRYESRLQALDRTKTVAGTIKEIFKDLNNSDIFEFDVISWDICGLFGRFIDDCTYFEIADAFNQVIEFAEKWCYKQYELIRYLLADNKDHCRIGHGKKLLSHIKDIESALKVARIVSDMIGNVEFA